MRRVLALIVLLASPSFGAWDKGFNFRATAGFVTDGTNETYCLAETYAVNRNGVTFGWTTALTDGPRDRDNGIDRRLAGLNQISSAEGTDRDFRVDLPAAGQYKISLALGDASNPNNPHIIIFDNTTQLLEIGEHTTLTAQWYDASDTLRTSAANWVSSNATATLTFATTTFILRLKVPSANGSVISHLFISQVTPPANPVVTILPGSAGVTTILPGTGVTTIK